MSSSDPTGTARGRPGTHLSGLVGILQAQVLGKHHLSLSTRALPNVHPGQHLVSWQLLIAEQLQGEREGHVHLADTMQPSPEAAEGRRQLLSGPPSHGPAGPSRPSSVMTAQPAGLHRPSPALQRASGVLPHPHPEPRQTHESHRHCLPCSGPSTRHPNGAVPAPGSGGASREMVANRP